MFDVFLLEEGGECIEDFGVMLYLEAHATLVGDMGRHGYHSVRNGSGFGGLHPTDKRSCGREKDIISHVALGTEPL